MSRITIIETGLVSPQFCERHGSYPQMFQRMVAAADPSVACNVVSVATGEALPDPATLDAILITGSAAGVYDDVAWIAPLEAFVRAAHDRHVPMVGVCFGHQLIAQALGGSRGRATEFAAFLRTLFESQDDVAEITESEGQFEIRQQGWKLMADVADYHPACASVLTGLFEGLAAGCGRHIPLHLKPNSTAGAPFVWSIG